MVDNLETSAIVDGFLWARIQQEGLEWPGSTTSTRDVKVGDKIDALLRTTRLFERENQSELNNMLEQCNVTHDDLIDQFDQVEHHRLFFIFIVLYR